MFQPSSVVDAGERKRLPPVLNGIIKQPKLGSATKRYRPGFDAVEPKSNVLNPKTVQPPAVTPVVLPNVSSVPPTVVMRANETLMTPTFTASKSMRQKNLDYNRPLPIFNADDTAEVLLRASQQMVTGIDKEEEFEYHLQLARDKREPIPVTRTLKVPKMLLEAEYKPIVDTQHAVYAPTSGGYDSILAYLILEPDVCEYNADTEDVKWVNEQGCLLGMDINKFEYYMEMLERTASASSLSSPAGSIDVSGRSAGRTMSTFGGISTFIDNNVNAMHFDSTDAVKRCIAELHSDSASIALYDYWLDKRCRIGRSLIPRVKAERKDGLDAKDPYVAFRRRTEKVQTRKNRRNEKIAYAALLRMAPEYSMLSCLLDQKMLTEQAMMEEINRERQLLSTVVALKDADGVIFREIERRVEHDLAQLPGGGGVVQQRGTKRSKYSVSQFVGDEDEFLSQNGSIASSAPTSTTYAGLPGADRRKRRKKLKRALPDPTEIRPVQFADMHAVTHSPYDSFDDTNSPDGRYTFLRKAFCFYQPPAVVSADDDEADMDSDGKDTEANNVVDETMLIARCRRFYFQLQWTPASAGS